MKEYINKSQTFLRPIHKVYCLPHFLNRSKQTRVNSLVLKKMYTFATNLHPNEKHKMQASAFVFFLQKALSVRLLPSCDIKSDTR